MAQADKNMIQRSISERMLSPSSQADFEGLATKVSALHLSDFGTTDIAPQQYIPKIIDSLTNPVLFYGEDKFVIGITDKPFDFFIDLLASDQLNGSDCEHADFARALSRIGIFGSFLSDDVDGSCSSGVGRFYGGPEIGPYQDVIADLPPTLYYSDLFDIKVQPNISQLIQSGPDDRLSRQQFKISLEAGATLSLSGVVRTRAHLCGFPRILNADSKTWSFIETMTIDFSGGQEPTTLQRWLSNTVYLRRVFDTGEGIHNVSQGVNERDKEELVESMEVDSQGEPMAQ